MVSVLRVNIIDIFKSEPNIACEVLVKRVTMGM